MVYQNKFVAAIKVNGQILRETNNHSVALPFGAEYSVLMKNLNARRIKVKVSVDGTEATGGTWLVIPPNQDLELERFIRDGNWQSGNRFKFIERTAAIEAHRGVKVDDGIVRIEYATEKAVVDQPIVNYYDEWYPIPRPYVPPCPRPWPYPRPRPFYGVNTCSASGMRSASRSMGASNRRASMSVGASASAGEAGITVAGSLSHQSFVSVSDFLTDASEVLTIHLRGGIAGKSVKQAVTVKSKSTCSTCGLSSKSGAEFCSRCGTALTIA